jgi:hypothetical protein
VKARHYDVGDSISKQENGDDDPKSTKWKKYLYVYY